MTAYEISIAIAADPATVWHALTVEMPADPVPFGIMKLDGIIDRNARLKLRSEVDPQRIFSLTVTNLIAPRTMVWRGGMPLGLFTGTRTFSLWPKDEGTRFEMREEFSGPLAGLIVRSIPNLTPSFEKFSQALKAKAERK